MNNSPDEIEFKIPTKFWLKDGQINLTMEVPKWLYDEMEFKTLYHTSGWTPTGSPMFYGSITFALEENEKAE